MTRIVFIRHGEPCAAALGTHYGQLDVDLSDTGRAQSLAVIERLQDVSFDAVYTSDLMRAAWMAERLAATQGCPLHVDSGLRERHLGAFQGMTYAAGQAFDPELARRMKVEGGMYRPEGGENMADLAARVLPVIEGLVAKHPNEILAVACHGGPIRVIVGAALGMELAHLTRVEIAYCSTTVIDYRAKGPKVRRLNA